MKNKIKKLFILAFLFYFSLPYSNAQTVNPSHINMPSFFGDNMVLQRDKPVKIWGTATAKAKFSILFAGEKKKVVADILGNWLIFFNAQKAGLVTKLEVLSDSSFAFKNVIMGDLWLASGQSNMEFNFGRTDSIAYDLVEDSNIRSFTVPNNLSSYPQKNFKKITWMVSDAKSALAFSAVAYYFAQKVHRETGVPIGIINSSWGGTSIKAWISEQGIAKIPAYKNLLSKVLTSRYTPYAIDSIANRNNRTIYQNNQAILKSDKGYVEQYNMGSKGTNVWKEITLPGRLHEDTLIKDKTVIWLRREIDLPAIVESQQFTVRFGHVVAFDEDMWINGIKIGSNNWWKNDNYYYLPSKLLKSGKNTIVARVTDKEGNGNFNSVPGEMQLKSVTDPTVYFPIDGLWEITSTLPVSELENLVQKLETSSPNTTVSSIYNAKISPFINLPISGFLWYQGENDAPVAAFYKKLFPIMIQDWRLHFKQGNLPFLFAQLPNYNNPITWVEMREAQASALQLPNTAMVVTLDVGNPNDIHPHNKKPVGERLANAALDMIYHKNGYPLCPLYQSSYIKNDGIHILFTNTGSGLKARNEKGFKGFMIAGENEQFIPAEAKIVNEREIVVTSLILKNPVSVRYAWIANADASLINKEGMPAAPFRTDSWKLVTEGKVDDKN